MRNVPRYWRPEHSPVAAFLVRSEQLRDLAIRLASYDRMLRPRDPQLCVRAEERQNARELAGCDVPAEMPGGNHSGRQRRDALVADGGLWQQLPGRYQAGACRRLVLL